MKISKILLMSALCGAFSLTNLHAACSGPGCAKDDSGKTASCSADSKQCPTGGKSSSKGSKQGKCGKKLAKMMKKFDANADGNLNGNELVAMVQACHDKQVRAETRSSSPKSAQLAQVEPFNAKRAAAEMLVKFDKNGNGSLNAKEIKAAMAACAKEGGKCSSGSKVYSSK